MGAKHHQDRAYRLTPAGLLATRHMAAHVGEHVTDRPNPFGPPRPQRCWRRCGQPLDACECLDLKLRSRRVTK